MAHRRKSSLVLPISTLDKRSATSSATTSTSANLHATVHAGLSAALTAALSPIHSRAPSPVPVATPTMDAIGLPSRERTYSDELELASMNDDAPIPDLAHLAAPFADFLSAPPTPGTPSKLDPDLKPQYGSRSPSSVGVVGAVGVSAGALRTRSYIRALLRRLTTFLASAPQSPLPLKSPHRLRDPPSTHRRLPVPLPLRRRATALALLVLLALCAWIVLFSGQQQRGGSSDALATAGGPYRAWANDVEDVNLDELDPEERRRLLSSAAFRGPQTKPNRTRPKMNKGKAKGKAKAKHPASPGLNGGSSSSTTHNGGLMMTPADELAALTSFLLNAGSNSLSAAEDGGDGVDPSKPLDPSRVLTFDPARMGVQKARAELEELKIETWAVNPVVVFGKSRHAPTRELRGLLDGMRLKPAPTVFEVDMRVDESVLTPLLARIVSSMASPSVRREFFISESDETESSGLELELPLLLIGGEPIPLRKIMPSFNTANAPGPDTQDNGVDGENKNGGEDAKEEADNARVRALEDLARRLRAAGAVPQPPKRRKGGK